MFAFMVTRLPAERQGFMTKKDVIANLMASYRKYGVSQEFIKEQIKTGEARGFSYQTIYTGLRMALGTFTGEQELFTISEMAEALGKSESDIIHKVEEMKRELAAEGKDSSQYVQEIAPESRQRFMILPGGLL